MSARVRELNSGPIRRDRRYVLYWSQMNRRVSQNHVLAYAIEHANALDLPLLVYEGLTCDYPYANDRIHTFMLENVPEFGAQVRGLGAGYCFYLRRKHTDANDLVYRLAQDVALLVTDDYPTFIPARHNARVPEKVDIAFHAVDGSCIVPMNQFTKQEWAAYTIRPKIHRALPDHLHPVKLPKLRNRWDGQTPDWHVEATDGSIAELVHSCDIDHSVRPSTCFHGGYRNASARLEHFLTDKLPRYGEDRNDAARHGTSNLSPYLHFGHISSLEVALKANEHATNHVSDVASFLEELIVRRELSFNFVRHAKFESLDSLPDWARANLRKHAGDPRRVRFSRGQMEAGETYDDLWNATQKELLLRGKIHGYYRMYWGKKIIEWSPTYEEAFDAMIYFHDRYALDGRDPNTYTSVLWCFGLHDRPWTERPVFGKMRYMSYEGMKRKTNMIGYIREIAELERTGKDMLAL